jgi:hypothetical protein
MAEGSHYHHKDSHLTAVPVHQESQGIDCGQLGTRLSSGSLWQAKQKRKEQQTRKAKKKNSNHVFSFVYNAMPSRQFLMS